MTRVRLQAICINRKRVNASDSYITLFSRQFGLVDVYVNNANSPRSGLNRGIQLFTFGEYFVQGKETLTLKSVQVQDNFYSLMEDYDSYLDAALLSNILRASLKERDSNPELFELFVNSISVIDKFPQISPKTILYFEVQLSIHLGIALDLSHCCLCDKEASSVDIEEGLVYCDVHGSEQFMGDPHQLLTLQKAYRYRFKDFMNTKMDNHALQAARTLIEAHILAHMGIDIKGLRQELTEYKGDKL